MSDLREYRFSDWLSIFLKAVPALWVALVVIAAIVILPIVLALLALRTAVLWPGN